MYFGEYYFAVTGEIRTDNARKVQSNLSILLLLIFHYRRSLGCINVLFVQLEANSLQKNSIKMGNFNQLDIFLLGYYITNQ